MGSRRTRRGARGRAHACAISAPWPAPRPPKGAPTAPERPVRTNSQAYPRALAPNMHQTRPVARTTQASKARAVSASRSMVHQTSPSRAQAAARCDACRSAGEGGPRDERPWVRCPRACLHCPSMGEKVVHARPVLTARQTLFAPRPAAMVERPRRTGRRPSIHRTSSVAISSRNNVSGAGRRSAWTGRSWKVSWLL